MLRILMVDTHHSSFLSAGSFKKRDSDIPVTGTGILRGRFGRFHRRLRVGVCTTWHERIGLARNLGGAKDEEYWLPNIPNCRGIDTGLYTGIGTRKGTHTVGV